MERGGGGKEIGWAGTFPLFRAYAKFSVLIRCAEDGRCREWTVIYFPQVLSSKIFPNYLSLKLPLLFPNYLSLNNRTVLMNVDGASKDVALTPLTPLESKGNTCCIV